MNTMLKTMKNIHRILIGITVIILFCGLLYISNAIKATASANSESGNISADIDATLLQPNPNPTTAKIGDKISVKYRLKTIINDGDNTGQSSITKVVDVNKIQEAVFVVDISATMKTQARQTYVGNGLCNQILNNSVLKSNGIKLGIIGVGSNVINFRGDNNEQNYNNRNLLNLNNDSERPVFEGRIKKAYTITDSQTPNVMDGLVEADNILQQEGAKDAVKAIILIVGGNFTYDETKIRDLKSRGYKIIVMDISYNQTQQKNLAQGNLTAIYNFLGGYDDSYYLGQYQTGGIDRTYNYADSDCKKLALALQGGTYNRPYVLTNVKLNFDLGEGFAADAGDPNIREGHKYVVPITDIVIKCTIIQKNYNGDVNKVLVEYKPEIENQDIEFNVKFIKDTMDEDGVVFGTKDTVNVNNNLSYDDINGNPITPKYIETPIVNNKVPIIKAEIVNPPTQINLSDNNGEIQLTYRVEPKEFNQTAISNDWVHKDVVFALDISQTDKNHENGEWEDEEIKVQQVEDALFNNLINNSETKNSKYGIITYSQTNQIYDTTIKLIEPIELSKKIKDLQTTNSGSSQIDWGELKARKMLESYGSSEGVKYLVSITSGHGYAANYIKSDSSNKYDDSIGVYNATINDPTIGIYNRITLDLSNIDVDSDPDKIAKIIQAVFNKIENAKPKSYTFNTKLKFHAGENFSEISGINALSDSWYDLETPEFEVKYTLDNDGYYVPEKVNNVAFTIEVKKTGNLEFGDSSSENALEKEFSGTISYTGLSGELIYNRISSFPITVSNPSLIKILKHGLYEGIKDGGPSIDEGKNTSRTFNCVKEVNVNLGVTLQGSISNDSEEVKLGIPVELAIKPIVYTYDSDGNLHETGVLYLSSTDSEQKNYKYKGEQIIDKNILILYSEIPQNTGTYINHLYLKDMPDRSVTIIVGDKPELF